MKVVIIEDEHFAAEKLIRLLGKIAPNFEIEQVLESVEEAANWFSDNKAPDLIFMDIQLDDGISFEIFDIIKIDTPIIFTTAFDEYALRAFKVNSIDYLLKPIEQEALGAALKKFTTLQANNQDFELKISKAIEQMSNKYKSRFFLKIGSRFRSIQVAEIACFFVEERNTFIKTVTGKNYDLDFSLEQVQKLLNPNKFFRVNRNYLININSIREIISYSSNRLKILLHNSEEGIIVSRDKVADFKHWMDR